MRVRFNPARGLRKFVHRQAAALAGTGIFSVVVLSAAAVSAQSPGTIAGDVSPLPSLVRLLAAFIAVVVLLFVMSALLKRFRNRKRAGTDRFTDVLEVLPLGAKSKLITVRLGRRIVVLGAGDSSVNRIAELDESEYNSSLDREDGAAVVSFRERFAALARK